MALKKSKIIKYGYTAEYWKIINFKVNAITSTAHWQLGLYKDKPQRNISPEIPIEIISFSKTDKNMFENVRYMQVNKFIGLMYNIIKEPKWVNDPQEVDINGNPKKINSNWFSDAEDIYE